MDLSEIKQKQAQQVKVSKTSTIKQNWVKLSGIQKSQLSGFKQIWAKLSKIKQN